MEELQTKQQLLAVQQVLGHTYGISMAAVRQIQAAGKVAILDLDKVSDAVQLKAAGFKVGSYSKGWVTRVSQRLHTPGLEMCK
jgi:guanylate kinase